MRDMKAEARRGPEHTAQASDGCDDESTDNSAET